MLVIIADGKETDSITEHFVLCSCVPLAWLPPDTFIIACARPISVRDGGWRRFHFTFMSLGFGFGIQ